jgi:glucose/arabinose dehydrogenase
MFPAIHETRKAGAFRKVAKAGLALSLAASMSLAALPTGFNSKELITGLDLVSSCILPDGRVMAVEKKGKITMIKPDGTKSVALDWTANTRDDHEAGMMQALAHPNFASNGFIYVTYADSRQGANGHDMCVRFKMTGDVIDGASEKKILDLGDAGPNYHHGDGLAISPDGKYLFICSGSRHGGGDNQAGQDAAANKTVLEGKIHRVLMPDGEIPSDNPFFATNTGDAKGVYWYGLRNPATPSFAKDGTMWFCDIQPDNGDDEVNEASAGGTGYGYGGGGTKGPLWTAGGINFAGGGMIGGLWYTGTNFPEAYQNHYFVGQVRGGGGNLKVTDAAHKTFTSFGPFTKAGEATSDYNPVDVKMDAAGAIYISTRFQTENVSWTKGKIVKVWYGSEPTVFSPGRPRAVASFQMKWTNLAAGGLSVQVLREGEQTVELQDLQGRTLARRVVSGEGSIELPAATKGLHVLVWKSGSQRAAVKVML